jgi:hypothetical protein
LSGFCWRDLREKDHLEDSRVGRKIILKWIFRKWDVAWTGLIWLRTEICAFGCGNELFCSIKCGEFID